MKVFDDETRRRLATGWDSRVCTAREYANTVGASERALRVWRARYQVGAVPQRHDSVPLDDAQDALWAVAARLGPWSGRLKRSE